MDDSYDGQLLAGLRMGDASAWARCVERWAPAIFGLLAAGTTSQAEATEDTVQAFQIAGDSLPRLEARQTLRAHLFGAAWRTLTRGEGRGPGAELAALRILHNEQRLSEAELAQALGVTGASAAVLVRRIGARPEAAASRAPGLEPPADLTERILSASQPRPLPRLRPVAIEHGGTRTRAGRGAWLLFGAAAAAVIVASGLVLPASPFALRGGGDDGAQAASSTTSIPGAAPAFAVSATTTRSPGGGGTATQSVTGSATSTRTATAIVPSTVAVTAIASTTVSPPLSPTATVTAVPTATPTPPVPSPTPSASPTAAATPTPTATTCVASLSVQVGGLVRVLPGMRSFFPVFNAFCGPAAFTVELTGGPWLEVSPRSGTIASGGQVPLTLLAQPPPEPGTYTATIRIVGPANTIGVLVSVERP